MSLKRIEWFGVVVAGVLFVSPFVALIMLLALGFPVDNDVHKLLWSFDQNAISILIARSIYLYLRDNDPFGFGGP